MAVIGALHLQSFSHRTLLTKRAMSTQVCLFLSLITDDFILYLLESKYEQEVRLWVLQEKIIMEGNKEMNLTDVINQTHENKKYLPDFMLSKNIIASDDLQYVCEHADIICFVVPHQFAENIILRMKDYIKPSAIIISCTKGMTFSPQGPQLVSSLIQSICTNATVGVLSGGNVAKDIAAENFATTTLAMESKALASDVAKVFESSAFRIELSDDIAGAEICGALKNVLGDHYPAPLIPSFASLFFSIEQRWEWAFARDLT